MFAAAFAAMRADIVTVASTDVGFIHAVDGDDGGLFLGGIYLAGAMRGKGLGSAVLSDLMDRRRIAFGERGRFGSTDRIVLLFFWIALHHEGRVAFGKRGVDLIGRCCPAKGRA
jgi:GNAT superfamily N-acetyltransferase